MLPKRGSPTGSVLGKVAWCLRSPVRLSRPQSPSYPYRRHRKDKNLICVHPEPQSQHTGARWAAGGQDTPKLPIERNVAVGISGENRV